MLSVRQTEGAGVIPCAKKQPGLREKAVQNGYDQKDVDFLEQLEQDYPEFRLMVGKKFAFKPPRTVMIGPKEPFFRLLTLHEFSHAILGHRSFKIDVERLKMENAAWDKARELAQKYKIEVDDDLIQDELDTYRDWLHQKSRCPKCGLTRYQAPDGVYHCPRCEEFTTKKG